MTNLATIVQERNLEMLEAYCLSRTYLQVRTDAAVLGIDLGELEELLEEIS